MNLPPYTALMSVYIQEKPEYLSLSIQSMLDQTVPPDEFIIVKDGPLTPELDKVIDSFEKDHPGLFVILANKENLGLGPASAKGVEAARNELIARIDSDDYSAESRCERQLIEFEKDPELGIVGTLVAEFVDDPDHIVSTHHVPGASHEIAIFMRRRCAFLHSSVMYKKSAVLKCGSYRSVPLFEDYDLFIRMVLEHHVKSCNIQEALHYMRVSEDFFKRRGGIKHAQTALRFKWAQCKKGYISPADFLISGIGQAFVCVLPNFMRKRFYMKFLRK